MEIKFWYLPLTILSPAMIMPGCMQKNPASHHLSLSRENVNKSQWEFENDTDSFFKDIQINQIFYGNTPETKSQIVYATTSGLYVQKTLGAKPLLITNFSDKKIDISTYNFHSVIANREGRQEYFLNVTTSAKDGSKNTVLLMKLQNNSDFSTAQISYLGDFVPTQGDEGHLSASQVIQVSNWTFGIYTQNNGYIGLVWDTNWKGHYQSSRIYGLNNLNLKWNEEKYVQMSQDPVRGRLIITTAKHVIIVYFIRSDADYFPCASFSFIAEQGKQVSPANFSKPYLDETNQHLVVNSDMGLFSVEYGQINACEGKAKDFTMYISPVKQVPVNENLNRVQTDPNSGLWLLTSNGLFYSENTNNLLQANFVAITNGLEDVNEFDDLYFFQDSNEQLNVVVTTNKGVYIGVEKEIKPDPTPTPTPTPSPASNKSLSNGAIVGIVVGGVSLIAAGVAGSFYLIRKNK